MRISYTRSSFSAAWAAGVKPMATNRVSAVLMVGPRGESGRISYRSYPPGGRQETKNLHNSYNAGKPVISTSFRGGTTMKRLTRACLVVLLGVSAVAADETKDRGKTDPAG